MYSAVWFNPPPIQHSFPSERCSKHSLHHLFYPSLFFLSFTLIYLFLHSLILFISSFFQMTTCVKFNNLYYPWFMKNNFTNILFPLFLFQLFSVNRIVSSRIHSLLDLMTKLCSFKWFQCTLTEGIHFGKKPIHAYLSFQRRKRNKQSERRKRERKRGKYVIYTL